MNVFHPQIGESINQDGPLPRGGVLSEATGYDAIRAGRASPAQTLWQPTLRGSVESLERITKSIIFTSLSLLLS
ncbi:hypothetical protein BN2476_210080 [Paraburkholderia piptadeniae]|uniref:Uncharacterized protein n=1 Tax=Paraburkholderia piptadeniae TaxID=1701573 RepID=A0A1N7RVP6_9BURK|nr:hypothetical protein BN2476_210080 [Paraburkholderia piptadeniae]